MSNTVAVMNTKGGVGKSTIVLALAETLAAVHGKRVLVIDSDAQATVSSMLMTVSNLFQLQRDGLTMVDFLVARVLRKAPANWSEYVVGNVSDVDDADGIYIIPSDMQLTLFEREVSKESMHADLRLVISEVLSQVRKTFDVILIDCPPGLSVLTESWLRESDYHVSPTKADYISICGLEVFRRFKGLNPEMGFARNLGVIINMREPMATADSEYVKWLREQGDNQCFKAEIPRVIALQDAARFQTDKRSYFAKYPGLVGDAVRALTSELLERLSAAPESASDGPAESEIAQGQTTAA